jgi:carboxyl-terminal processing protease
MGAGSGSAVGERLRDPSTLIATDDNRSLTTPSAVIGPGGAGPTTGLFGASSGAATMPRRNIYLLLTICLVSLICHQKVQPNRYGRVLVDAMGLIEQRFVEPIGQDELFEAAMEGMVGLLDSNSAFISPRMLPRFREAIDQEFGGIGIEVLFDRRTSQLTVVRPLVGTPAYEAGILAGDRILKIDGQSTQGLSADDAAARMRGEPDEPVTLSILHEGEQRPVEITIVRAIIRVNTVQGDTRRADGSWDFSLEGHPGIAYMRITTFAEKTPEELLGALESVGPGMKGLILDLRDDPGGALQAAEEVCDLFIESGVIVTTRRRGAEEITWAKEEGTCQGFPMVVLVNQYSASASEIVAACLQDHQRARIVGQRTYGKGTVQEVIYLEGRQGALKLTTASYWRPSEANIHRDEGALDEDPWGVMPDEGCKVVVEGDDLKRLRLWRARRDERRLAELGQGPVAEGDLSIDNDKQLLKAVEYLEREIAGGQ